MATTEKPDFSLNFEPITDGLGFHPFSDGLPYAPVAKTSLTGSGLSTPSAAQQAAAKAAAADLGSPPRSPRSPQNKPASKPMGTGAVAAGPARFVTQPSPGVVRVSVPVASPPRTVAQRTQTQQALQTSPPLRFESSFGMIYLVKRVLAYTLDTALNASLCLGALSAALWNQNLRPELLFNPGVAFVAFLFVAVFSWALVTAEEIAFGTTVGKRIFGLALQGGASAIFLRSFFFVPSVGFCGLGLIWAVFDRRKRCWHDVVVDLQPMEIAKIG